MTAAQKNQREKHVGQWKRCEAFFSTKENGKRASHLAPWQVYRIFKKVVLYKEKFEFLGSCETKEAAESIQNAARILVDEQILAKIAGVDLIAKEAKYHHSCKI